MRTLAKIISSSVFFSRARKLLELNTQDWDYPLIKWEKLWVGCYMILRDYGNGAFPPQRTDEETAFVAEKGYYHSLQKLGKTAQELRRQAMRKPFWAGPGCAKHLQNYIEAQNYLHKYGIHPPSKLLEVGCGSGWMAEFFALSGFRVLATTLDADLGEMIDQRQKSLVVKDLPAALQFRSAPMEYIQQATADLGPFDAVYVHEALHHAHDWRKATRAFHECLRPGGWCFLLNEPNLIHTFVSYRVGRLSNTHEIGINPSALKRHLREVGFGRVKVLGKIPRLI